MEGNTVSKYEPKCETTGNAPYLRTESSWGRSTYRIVYAANLTEAKAQHGYTRMRYTRVTVRRAVPTDRALATYGWCGCPEKCNKESV
jgi:hypothetical protein